MPESDKPTHPIQLDLHIQADTRQDVVTALRELLYDFDLGTHSEKSKHDGSFYGYQYTYKEQ